MIHYFITTETFHHQVVCFCPDKKHTSTLTIDKADVLQVIDHESFLFEEDWYWLVTINNEIRLYIARDKLTAYYNEGKLVSDYDVSLQLNYLQFQIDRSLETRDKESFLKRSKELRAVQELKEKLEAIHSAEKVLS